MIVHPRENFALHARGERMLVALFLCRRAISGGAEPDGDA